MSMHLVVSIGRRRETGPLDVRRICHGAGRSENQVFAPARLASMSLRKLERAQAATKAHLPPEGRSSPLGATPVADGANFSLYTKHAMGVELLLFDAPGDAHAARVISF